jgi:hypothetical protein
VEVVVDGFLCCCPHASVVETIAECMRRRRKKGGGEGKEGKESGVWRMREKRWRLDSGRNSLQPPLTILPRAHPSLPLLLHTPPPTLSALRTHA